MSQLILGRLRCLLPPVDHQPEPVRALVSHASCGSQASGYSRPTTRRAHRWAAPASGTPRPSRSASRTCLYVAPGPARSAAPAGQPAAPAVTCSTPWPTRSCGGRTAACAATPALSDRAVEQAAPASALGGPLADARERLRTPHPRTRVIVGVGPGPAW